MILQQSCIYIRIIMYRLERARKQVQATPMDTLTCGEGMLKEKLAGMSPQDLVVKLNDVSGMNHLKERYVDSYYSIYLIIYIYLLIWAGSEWSVPI